MDGTSVPCLPCALSAACCSKHSLKLQCCYVAANTEEHLITLSYHSAIYVNVDLAMMQKLGSALGYALLLTRVLAYYLHAPLLHCLVYQGSTSSLAPLPAQRDSVSVADDTSSTLAVLYIAGSTAMPAAASM